MSDVIVIGASAVGLATTSAIAKRGFDVTCLEARSHQEVIDSTEWAHTISHPADDPDIIELSELSRAEWSRLERESGRVLLGREGELICSPKASHIAQILQEAGVQAEELKRWEASSRFPFVNASGTFLFDPSATTLRSRAAIKLLLDRSQEEVLFNTVAHEIREESQGWRVITGDKQIQGERLVIAAGRHTARVARPTGVSVPLNVKEIPQMRLRGVRGRWPLWRDDTSQFGDRVRGVPLGAGFYEVESSSISRPRRLLRYSGLAFPELKREGAVRGSRWKVSLDDSLPVEVYQGEGVWAIAGEDLFANALSFGTQLAEEVISNN